MWETKAVCSWHLVSLSKSQATLRICINFGPDRPGQLSWVRHSLDKDGRWTPQTVLPLCTMIVHGIISTCSGLKL